MKSLVKQILPNNPMVLYFIVIILGVMSGLSNISFLNSFALVITNIFIKCFQFISLPVISLSIIVTLAALPTDGSIKKLWQKTILYTFSTTLLAAIISCVFYLLIKPHNVQTAATALTQYHLNQSNYSQHLTTLIPSNIFTPFLENQVISVLFISLLIGIALRYIQDENSKQTVVSFFRGLHQLFFVITKWLIAILPIGIYGFVTTTIIQLKSNGQLGGIGEYLAIVILANLFQGFIILPLWLKLNGIKPFQTMRLMLPALSVAFFSKSSAATLPVTINTIEKNLNVDPKISRFLLPLCTSLNMNGCAAFIFATVIFIMQNQGIDISLASMGLWVIIATIAAIGNAGVPMGCFFLSASLLASMNMPITLLGIILPFYNIIDMVETALNVWSDSCVTKIINDQTLESSPDDLPLAEVEKIT